ncbi:uncharacterized protein N7479_000536 [Penicillium vulpinum]|uniref:Nephrocystin 3-like N-terminal domain-containing protein n=1 Tax=Penicillium vulpinum TaxID=29845 RepID=A0A1V6S504_9EURO|nr:uncharacterized protein N7479_000536 [Penicillium vulpinum]KAJ5970618.1 hypothetical protein N7479_000536 [Penicillium vulpinum]OQE09135.1 hypothetical protein PENVUL_c007G10210 [Penicillium vulpinum]
MNNNREECEKENEDDVSPWERAYTKLSEKDQAKLQKILNSPAQDSQADASSDRTNVTDSKDLANQLLGSCQNAKKEYMKKKWVLPIGKNKIVLHTLWDDSIQAVQKVKDLGTALTGLNQTASSAWSIAMVLVDIPVKKAEVANSVVQGLGKAIIIMARGVDYERQAEEMRGDKGLIRYSERFESKLLDLYTETLKFFAAVSRYYQRHSISRTWHSVWGSDAISNFDKSTTEIELELNTWVQVKFQDKTDAQLQAIQQFLEDLKNEKQQRDEEDRARVWLSDLPYLAHHKTAKSGRTPDTGEWIFENTDYKNWITSDQKAILCINGIPGAGKTKLISRLVDFYNDALEDDKPHEEMDDEVETSQLAYFYCRQDDTNRQDWRNILCTLAKQLTRSCNRLPTEVMRVFKQRGKLDSPDPNMTSLECEEILKCFIQHNGKVTLILDAFDECAKDTKRILLEVFDRLAQSALPVSVIMSSRDDDSFTGFQNMTKVKISSSDNGEDIIKFVREKISEFRADEKRRGVDSGMSRLSPDLEDQIIVKFEEKSNGMFQWASLHIQYILSLSDMVAMKEALEELPEDLKRAYDGMFKLIDDDKSWKNIALRAFRWLHANGGSCKTSVLVAAASHDLDRTIDAVHKTIQDVSMIKAKCRNLLDIGDDVSRFAHLSVQEYFSEVRSEGNHCPEFAAKICLRTLTYYNPVATQQNPILEDLWQHAHNNWFDHAKSSKDMESLKPFILDFLRAKPDSHGQIRWRNELISLVIPAILSERVRITKISEFLRDPYRWLVPERFSWMKSFWEMETLRNRHNVRYLDYSAVTRDNSLIIVTVFTAVAYSQFYAVQSEGWIEFGDQESVATLFEHIESSISEFKEPAWMDFNREIESPSRESDATDLIQPALYLLIFSMILSWWNDMKESLNAFLRVTQTPSLEEVRTISEIPQGERSLNGVTSKERSQVLDMILTRMISEMRQKVSDGIGEIEEIGEISELRGVELLSMSLVKVSDKNHPVLQELAALMVWAVCLSGYSCPEQPIPPSNVVDYLFESFDFKSRVKYRCLPLNGYDMPRVCFYTKDQRYLDFMLANGDVNFTPTTDNFGIYGTPLIAAIGTVKDGDKSGIELLLNNGANVNCVAEIGSYGTALIAACAQGDDTIVEMLLDGREANLNQKSSLGSYGTALIAATATKAYTTARRLIDNGADPNARVDSGQYYTAIHAAIDLGCTRIIFLLAVNGSNKPSSEDLSQDSLVATERRRDCWDQECQLIVVDGAQDDKWIEQCNRAGKQLSAAVMFKWLGISIQWAEPYLVEACKCLSWYSSYGRTDYRASGKLADILGYGGEDGVVKQQLYTLIKPMGFRSVEVEEVYLFLDELMIFMREAEKCKDMIELPNRMMETIPARFVRIDSLPVELPGYDSDDMGASDADSDWSDAILD